MNIINLKGVGFSPHSPSSGSDWHEVMSQAGYGAQGGRGSSSKEKIRTAVCCMAMPYDGLINGTGPSRFSLGTRLQAGY